MRESDHDFGMTSRQSMPNPAYAASSKLLDDDREAKSLLSSQRLDKASPHCLKPKPAAPDVLHIGEQDLP